MATVARAVDIIGPDGARVHAIEVTDLLEKYGPYKVGRWARITEPDDPDRCDWCPLEDIRPAVGYVTMRGTKRGYCQEHEEQAKREAGA